MTRLFFSALAAFALSVSTPALAGDCHGDCANCPHRGATAKGEPAGKEAPPCACAGKECKCPQGCKCDHCAHKADEKAPKAPAKT